MDELKMRRKTRNFVTALCESLLDCLNDNYIERNPQGTRIGMKYLGTINLPNLHWNEFP